MYVVRYDPEQRGHHNIWPLLECLGFRHCAVNARLGSERTDVLERWSDRSHKPVFLIVFFSFWEEGDRTLGATGVHYPYEYMARVAPGVEYGVGGAEEFADWLARMSPGYNNDG